MRDDAVSRIQQALGFRIDRIAECQAALIEAQRLLEKGQSLPKFMLNEDQPLTLLAGTSSVALPDDFLRRSRDIPITFLPIYSNRPKEIPWRDYEHARMAYRHYNPRGPLVAALRKDSIFFTPTADRDYALTWTYYKKAALLTTNIENVWLSDDNMPEFIIGVAGLSIASDIRNQAAMAIFQSMQARAKAALFGEQVQDEADDGITMGGDS